MIKDQIKKTISTAKLIVIAEELKNNSREISIATLKQKAKEKNINIDNITYPEIVKILKQNNYDFCKVFDRNKFAQRRIEMAQLTREGWTLQMIGDKYGITRQAVSLLLKKAAADDNQIVVKARTKKSNPEKNVVFVKRIKGEHRKCSACGKEFFSKNKRKTCSKGCFTKLMMGGEWSRLETVDLVCDGCGKTFQRSKYLHKITTISKGNSKNNYCSRDCYHGKNKQTLVQGN